MPISTDKTTEKLQITVDSQQKLISNLSLTVAKLDDRVADLEIELSATQKKIQNDIRNIIERTANQF